MPELPADRREDGGGRILSRFAHVLRDAVLEPYAECAPRVLAILE